MLFESAAEELVEGLVTEGFADEGVGTSVESRAT